MLEVYFLHVFLAFNFVHTCLVPCVTHGHLKHTGFAVELEVTWTARTSPDRSPTRSSPGCFWNASCSCQFLPHICGPRGDSWTMSTLLPGPCDPPSDRLPGFLSTLPVTRVCLRDSELFCLSSAPVFLALMASCLQVGEPTLGYLKQKGGPFVRRWVS